MLKNILNLEGAAQLTATEQKKIKGGIPYGCQFVYYPGTSLADCRIDYPNALFNATTQTCKALDCTPINPEF